MRKPRGRDRAQPGAMPGAGPLAPTPPAGSCSRPGPPRRPPSPSGLLIRPRPAQHPAPRRAFFPPPNLDYISQRAPRGPTVHAGRQRAAGHAGTRSPPPPPAHRSAGPAVPQRRPGQGAVLPDAHVLAHGHDGVERAHHALRRRHRHHSETRGAAAGRARGGRSEGTASGGGGAAGAEASSWVPRPCRGGGGGTAAVAVEAVSAISRCSAASSGRRRAARSRCGAAVVGGLGIWGLGRRRRVVSPP